MTSLSRMFCFNTVKLPSYLLSFQMFLNTRSSQTNTSVCTHAMDSGATLKCAWEWSVGETFSKFIRSCGQMIKYGEAIVVQGKDW